MSELERIINDLKGKKVAGIYKITSPSGRVYVGSSINIRSRFMQYKRLGCKGQPKLYKSLIKYGTSCHKFCIIEELTEQDSETLNTKLSERELYWGILLKTLSPKNLNLKLGDRCAIFSEETKEKITKQLLERPQASVHQYSMEGVFIKTWDKVRDAAKSCDIKSKRINQCCSGRDKSAGGYLWSRFKCEKLEYNNKTLKGTVDRTAYSKIVLQYDLEGNFIKEWPSAASAIKNLKLKGANVHRCCKGFLQKSGGYIWRYKDDFIELDLKPRTNSIPIIQYTLAGDFIREWKSCTEAADKLGLWRGAIQGCCSGVYKTAYKFIWKYKKDALT